MVISCESSPIVIVDLERVVDAGDGVVRELDVDDGAVDPGDATDSAALGLDSSGCFGHGVPISPVLLV